MSADEPFPPLHVAGWAPTKRTLHLCAQMLGKLRLALAPHQPNFIFTALALTPRGFGTGPIPVGPRLLAAELDVFDAHLLVTISDGAREAIAVGDARTIGNVFADLHAALRRLGVEVALSPIPQEIPDRTPLDTDLRPATLDAEQARRWLAAMCATQAAFERWRTHFFGRTGLQLWWGAFDLSLLLFNGKKAVPPAGRGYLFTYDLDAEMVNVGLYLGDETTPPFYYGYIYPEPPECARIPMPAEGATWSSDLHEWMLPYEHVSASREPERVLHAFLDAVYAAATSSAGWHAPSYTYVPPPLRRAP